MNRYLLPLAIVALFFFAGQSAFAHEHGWGGGNWGGCHHNYQTFRPGFSIGFGSGYGLGYGGLGYGANYGYAPTYGGPGYGYSRFASPFGYGYPQSYFASPGYGQWGGFGPGF